MVGEQIQQIIFEVFKDYKLWIGCADHRTISESDESNILAGTWHELYMFSLSCY